MLVVLSLLALDVFPDTVSPSMRWGVSHIEKAGVDINQFIDLQDMRVVATLKGFDGVEGQNHGGMFAAYSKTESFAAVMQANKWEPRALCLVSTKTGTQIDMVKRVQADSAAYFKGKQGKRFSFVFDVTGAKFDGDRVNFSMIGEVPRGDNAPVVYLSLSYGVKLGQGKILLTGPVSKSLSSAKVWNWPKQSSMVVRK
ncbi:MAG: hypothetical protein K8R88_15435 [Armatimonadetes bacterium]|nr:hypothetical protein [Armatimonadota bacterium]